MMMAAHRSYSGGAHRAGIARARMILCSYIRCVTGALERTPAIVQRWYVFGSSEQGLELMRVCEMCTLAYK